LPLPVGPHVDEWPPELSRLIEEYSVLGELDAFADPQTSFQQKFKYGPVLLRRSAKEFALQLRRQDEFPVMPFL
jgi:hypothetical protein